MTETDRAVRGCPEELARMPDWQVLLNHFRYGVGCGVIVLLVPDEKCAEHCRTEVIRELRALGKGIVDASFDTLPTIVWASEATQPAAAVWFDLGPWTDLDSTACNELAAKLNEIAPHFSRGPWKAPLVLVCPSWFQEFLLTSAIDVWCIRILVASISASTPGEFHRDIELTVPSSSAGVSSPLGPTAAPVLFISYSHKDRVWLNRLFTFIKPLVRENAYDEWDDRKINAGANWREEIAKSIRRARVAVLLVSQDFLASDFITRNELPPLLEAADRNGVTIMWIAVRYSRYRQSELAFYQSANNPDRPLASLRKSDCERELVAITEKIAGALDRSNGFIAP